MEEFNHMIEGTDGEMEPGGGRQPYRVVNGLRHEDELPEVAAVHHAQHVNLQRGRKSASGGGGLIIHRAHLILAHKYLKLFLLLGNSYNAS